MVRKKKRLTWYEKVCCCCKLRSKFMKIICVITLYIVPILLYICTAAVCITLGILYRDECSFNNLLPWYTVSCAVTPFMLLFFIKGVKDKGPGVTTWRLASLLFYVVFTVWLIIGSTWTYNAMVEACYPDCCKTLLLVYTLVITCVHWLFFLLATIPQVYIVVQICDCCRSDTVDPEKEKRDDSDIYD